MFKYRYIEAWQNKIMLFYLKKKLNDVILTKFLIYCANFKNNPDIFMWGNMRWVSVPSWYSIPRIYKGMQTLYLFIVN